MKAYRIIGSIFGSILMPVFIIVLCACLLVASAAGLITTKSITNMVESAMDNDDIQSSVSEVLVENLTIPGISDNPEMQDSINQIMSLPSVQGMISGIISDGAEELTSGNFDGELNVQEILQDTLTQDPELLSTMSTEIVDIMMENEELRNSIATSLLGENASEILGDELIDDLMQAPEVKNIFAKMITGTLQTGLQIEAEAINITDEMENLISENPALVEDVMDALIPNEEAFRNAIAEAATYAQENGLPAPDANISKLDFAAYYLDLYGDQLNSIFRNTNFDADVDYTDYETPTSSSDNALNLTFDEETVAMINQAAEILNILRSPLFILAILGILFFYYLLMALFTWSFRYPLMFCGITAILTGMLLIAITNLPVYDLLNASAATDSAELLVFSLITSVWGVLAKKIVLFGTTGIVLGILLITVFIITGIMIKNKKRAALLAEINANEAPIEA